MSDRLPVGNRRDVLSLPSMGQGCVEYKGLSVYPLRNALWLIESCRIVVATINEALDLSAILDRFITRNCRSRRTHMLVNGYNLY